MNGVRIGKVLIAVRPRQILLVRTAALTVCTMAVTGSMAPEGAVCRSVLASCLTAVDTISVSVSLFLNKDIEREKSGIVIQKEGGRCGCSRVRLLSVVRCQPTGKRRCLTAIF